MNKRLISLLAVVVLLMAVFATVASAAGYYPVYSHCRNGKPLNVRSGPSKDYPVIDKVPYGDAIYVIGETSPGWLQLNDFGYVQASLTSRTYPGPYVKPSGNGGSSSQSSASGAGSLNTVFKKARFVTPYTVTVHGSRGTGSVNVRWAPSTDCSVIQAYAYGYTLQVIAELGDWSQVTDPVTGVTGFAMSKFLYR